MTQDIATDSKATLARKRVELVEALATPQSPELRALTQGQLSAINAQLKAINKAEAAQLKAAADRRKSAGLAEAKSNATRASRKLGGLDVVADEDPAQTAAIDAWIVAVLRRGGVKVSLASDGNLDIVDAPTKWVAIIDALCTGIFAMARDQELPEVTAAPTRKVASKREQA